MKGVQNWAGPELGLGRDLNAESAMGLRQDVGVGSCSFQRRLTAEASSCTPTPHPPLGIRIMAFGRAGPLPPWQDF